MPLRDALELRLLGEISVLHAGRPQTLPQSRKTRALLAYLVIHGRPQRRDRLCAMFWDVADDPRGALRWSLSRLRRLLDTPKRQRLSANRDSVAVDLRDVWVDAHAVRQKIGAADAAPDLKSLIATAELFAGEFLEGLELPDFDEFQAWCMAEREQYRLLHAHLLEKIVEGLASDPAAALPHARTLARIDPLNEAVHVSVVRLLLMQGRVKEACRQQESGTRILRDAGIPCGGLQQALQAFKASQGGLAPDIGVQSAASWASSPGGKRLAGLKSETSSGTYLRAAVRTAEPGCC
jgi:DNA-binding SARP family transcriptional activator